MTQEVTRRPLTAEACEIRF